jgi:hexosaminidase
VGRQPGDTLDYTKLTSVSGHTAMDTQEYGYRDELGRTGFYTQQQYRSIVASREEYPTALVPFCGTVP